VELLAAWLLYPLALALLCLGLGLLVGRLADWRLAGVLLLPVGFVTLMALARLLVQAHASARLALPAVVALALVGLVVERERLRALRPDPWITLAALGVFAVFAAPVVLSGTPTFAGYLALPDTSHQLALADVLAHHGYDATGLTDGSLKLSMVSYLASNYPVGGQALLGVTAPLGALDLAWLYQPLLSFMAMISALALAGLVTPLLRHRWQAAVAAFVAAQSALVVGFALQGSIKEIALIAAVNTGVAVLAAAIAERRPARSLLALAIAAAAAIAAIGPVALAYFGVMAIVVVVVWGRRIAAGERSDLVWIAIGAAVAVLLALPVLSTLRTQFDVQSGTLSASTAAATSTLADIGNLAEPLKTEQLLGVWFNGDYRYTTNQMEGLQAIALVVAAILGVLGLAWALRRRAVGPLLLLAVLGLPSIYLADRASPYADAKVMAIFSTVVLLFAVLGALSLWRGPWRVLSLVATAGIVLAVGLSSALAYHDVSLTPYDRYTELLDLDKRLAGRGPVVFNEYDEFAKYFLRDAPGYSQPEWPHGYRHGPYHPNALADPKRRPTGKTPLDADDLTLAYMESVPYIVLRRSPTSSRPPANFARVWTGDYYELWQRRAAPRVLRHKPLGPDILHQAAVVGAGEARAWAERARGAGGSIAYAPRPRPAGFDVTRPRRPGLWNTFGGFPLGLVPAGPGILRGPLALPRSERYEIWAEGSFARRMRLSIDGREVAVTRPGLNNPGAYELLATPRLSRGRHVVVISQGGGDLRPGSGGYRSSLRHIGPVWFVPIEDRARRVVTIDPGDWRRLVGVRADWLEVVR
jgi:hypothetical protein